MIKRIFNIYQRLFWSSEKYARHLGVKIGKNCKISTIHFGSEPYLIEIGNKVQITQNVRFYNHGAAWVLREKDPSFDFFGKIAVGNNVYIGNSVIILPGVSIGNNVVIAAGSVVTKSFGDNFVIGGNPAKILASVDDFFLKYSPYNVKSKNMNYDEKRQFLESLDDDKFIKK